MYQGYFSDEDILFVRHYGDYEGAEGLEAIASALEANPPTVQINAVCIDFRAVTAVSLDDTDRANVNFYKRRFESYGQRLGSFLLVRVYEEENVAINKVLRERDERTAGSFLDLDAIVEVYNVPDALKALGLPADYRVKYPSEK
jgi:hypothetical protein|tara:strand:+ start:597 stop:1028 length:432 start_codon:yes stop_codon:yes gene_type:complete